MDSTPLDSLSEVRRVRAKMSDEAGHDVRRLIANINKRRAAVADRIIDPGTQAEQTDCSEAASQADLAN